jgi:hypothetical protein
VSAVLHIELVEQTADALQLRFWRENPNDMRTRTLALPEIADLVGKAETDYYSPLPAKLKDIGRRLYRWLNGGERWITAEIAAAANRDPVLVLAIAMPQRLAHLPWEVLHDGTTFLLHALNPPVLPVRWRNVAGGNPVPQNRPLQALFMASSPADVEPVLDYEHEEAVMLEATERRPLDLTVEESGCLEELGELVQDYARATSTCSTSPGTQTMRRMAGRFSCSRTARAGGQTPPRSTSRKSCLTARHSFSSPAAALAKMSPTARCARSRSS